MRDEKNDDAVEPSNSKSGSWNERDRSQFADLLEEISEQSESGRATESADSETRDDSPEDQDPLDRVRDLIAERVPPPPVESEFDIAPGTASENRNLYVGLVLGVVLVLILPGFIAATVGHARDTILAPPPSEYVDENSTLHVDTEDAAYLSRIFQETTHEVAYCGLITRNKEKPRLEIWMANTVNAGPNQVEFITDNCPDATREVLLHTHPNGILLLSNQDKQTLAERPEQFMCVQGGPLATEPGADVKNLVCYREINTAEGGLEVTRIRLVITELTAGSTGTTDSIRNPAKAHGGL